MVTHSGYLTERVFTQLNIPITRYDVMEMRMMFDNSINDVL